MDADFMMELEELLQNGEFEEAINKFDELDDDDMTPELYITLAHALSQCSRFREALFYLDKIRDSIDEDDFSYHLELAGAYYGLHHYRSALRETKNCLQIEDDFVDPWILLALIYQETGQDELFEEASSKAKELDEEAWGNVFGDRLDELEMYDIPDMDIISRHIVRNFGHFKDFFPVREKNGEVRPHPINIAMIPPDRGRDYYTLVSVGIGAYRGIETDENGDEHIHRVELCAFLPGHLSEEQVINDYQWVGRVLRQFGEMVQHERSWFGYGHSVSYGETFDESVGFNGIVFDTISPDDNFSDTFTLSNGESVQFLQILPVYEEEMVYKIDKGHNALFNKLRSMYYERYSGDDFGNILRVPSFLTGIDIIEPDRINTCLDKTAKRRLIPQSSIEDILDWEGADGCFATDRITVDGCKVGIMYREKPVEGQPDSGWRFLAGDEDEAYMNDTGKMDIYSLNTIANYDIDIIEYLEYPVGTVLRRTKGGEFRPARR